MFFLNSFSDLRRVTQLLWLIPVFTFCGCNSSTQPENGSAQANMDLSNAANAAMASNQDSPSSHEPNLPSLTQQPVDFLSQSPTVVAPPLADSPDKVDATHATANAPEMRRNEPIEPTLPIASEAPKPVSAEDVTSSKRRQLRPDLSPSELREFLASADADMQMIASGRAGITDRDEALAEMLAIVKAKLQGARRLMNHPDADENAISEGTRGELQSLSHLAALGDLKAALELETLAEKNLASNDPDLVSDSRLVLIGFAIEAMQNGKEGAPSRIVQLVKDLAKSSQSSDIPAMMVMGQARQTLSQYGYNQEAKLVRDTIIDLYANSSDAQVAKMAAQLAGNVQFDEIDRLLRLAIDGKEVSTDDWRNAAQELITQSPDLQTVQYLAGAALQFEGLDQPELAEVTYRELSESFPDTDAATGKEARLALDARKARLAVLGKTFEPDLPAIDDTEIKIADYQGKIVLIPFWAMGFQESLQLIPHLQQLAVSSPNDLAIIGMNLDPAGAPVEEFINKSGLGFPSYRAESSDKSEIPNEVAARFGMVSMPFLVVLDRDGKVASIDYTMNQLNKTLSKLRSDPPSPAP